MTSVDNVLTLSARDRARAVVQHIEVTATTAGSTEETKGHVALVEAAIRAEGDKEREAVVSLIRSAIADQPDNLVQATLNRLVTDIRSRAAMIR